MDYLEHLNLLSRDIYQYKVPITKYIVRKYANIFKPCSNIEQRNQLHYMLTSEHRWGQLLYTHQHLTLVYSFLQKKGNFSWTRVDDLVKEFPPDSICCKFLGKLLNDITRQEGTKYNIIKRRGDNVIFYKMENKNGK